MAAIVEAAPDFDETGLVRWRRVDLQALIEERFGVAYNERPVSRLLHELGFSHISARPYHPAQKVAVLEDVVHPRAADLDRPDPRLDLALRQVAMTNHSAPVPRRR